VSEANQTSDKPSLWRYYGKDVLLNLFVGIALIAIAAAIGNYVGIGPKFDLDMRGRAIQGQIEKLDENRYALRYEHPSGTIYRAYYTGSLGIQRPTAIPGPITLVYDPGDPRRFQPHGVSYIPSVPVGAAFIIGMIFVLRSRRLVIRRALPARKLSVPPSSSAASKRKK
jgi:hypothetical protein